LQFSSCTAHTLAKLASLSEEEVVNMQRKICLRGLIPLCMVRVEDIGPDES
jgi:hypothetical protein